jgi:hypothetical protein
MAVHTPSKDQIRLFYTDRGLLWVHYQILGVRELTALKIGGDFHMDPWYAKSSI